MKNSVYEQIKKQHGERFAKTIRGYHDGLFELPNIVEILKHAGNDAEPLLKYLMSLKKITIMKQTEHKDPLQLLAEEGYYAYYVTSFEEQNAIGDYYRDDEKLCTFYDPDRYKKNFIINAIHRDARNLRREDFEGKEEREDEYARSVLSIQIPREGGRIRILNRYNHTVPSSDNTFGGNPDRIVPGLAEALIRKFMVDFTSQEAKLPSGYTVLDQQVFRYHTERGDTYIGPNYYIQNQQLYMLDSDKEILLDHYIFNLKTREMTDILKKYCQKDAFPDVLASEIRGKKIQLTQNPDHGHTLWADGKPILTEKDGQVISFTTQVKQLSSRPLMQYSYALRELNAPNLVNLPNGSLFENAALETLNAPNIAEIGDTVLTYNTALKKINLPKCQSIGDTFLENNVQLYEFNAPNISSIGDYFLNKNKFLRVLDLPQVTKVGSDFIPSNHILRVFNAPKLERTEDYFLSGNREIEELHLPSLKSAGDEFMSDNVKMHTFLAPNMTYCGANFFDRNKQMQNLVLGQSLDFITNGFFSRHPRRQQLIKQFSTIPTIMQDFLTRE